ncbi:unnamed protein product [Caenorhabditis angaria]|uniref:Serpentine receptor class gamma n=1 Tax=Caenorhabditis angaria TaxID=860376 RepID=A0A9P1N8G9_9PELO|nr:unnamed protein product [Caenorhabditis angaria]
MNPFYLIIHVVFGVFSWILYAIVTIYIYHHRKEFNSAFMKLWNTFTIINFLQFTTMKMYWQIPLHTPKDSWFSDSLLYFNTNIPPYILTIVYFSAYYFIYCQRICVLLLIGISFRLIVFPFSSSPIWERKYILTAAIIFLLPLPFIYDILYLEPTFNYIKNLDGYVLFPSLKKYPEAARNILKCNFFEISTAIISGILKLFSILCLSAKRAKKRDDRNLYVVTSMMFFTSILKFACAILLVLNVNPYVQMAVIYIYPVSADFVALSCPYTLLFINERMRKSIWNKLTGKIEPVDV